MPASGSTQALAPAPAPAHRGGEAAEHLLERIAPLRLADPGVGAPADRRLTRLLVNVTVDMSLWPVHLVLGADATVADLVREGRRPPLQPGGGGDAADGFELHFSKYSLESLRPEEKKVVDLGSRNFFLCARRNNAARCLSLSFIVPAEHKAHAPPHQ